MLRSEVSITKIIGITGPTGAGKTTALNEVEKLGGAVIDCDAVYHELLESDIALQSKLEELFGPLRGEDGTIDRKKLGAIVFGPSSSAIPRSWSSSTRWPRGPRWRKPGSW